MRGEYTDFLIIRITSGKDHAIPVNKCRDSLPSGLWLENVFVVTVPGHWQEPVVIAGP
jgi:hypothetical protein